MITANAQIATLNRRKQTEFINATEYFGKAKFSELTADELQQCTSIGIFADTEGEVAEAQELAIAVQNSLQFASVEEPKKLSKGYVVNIRKTVRESATCLRSILGLKS